MASWLSNKRAHIALIATVAISVMMLVFYASPGLPSLSHERTKKVESLPDFSHYNNVDEKKTAFFEFMYPIIEEENRHLMTLRRTLLRLQESDNLSASETEWLKELAQRYLNEKQQQDSTEGLIDKLVRRVDIIPPSLVMAQAAIESAWGTSRFARQGNNLFGQWCFSKGCGIVPQQRSPGRTHEVAKFDTVNEAVSAYLRNLNAFHAYKSLREARVQVRRQNEWLSPTPLLVGLANYSEQGKMYLAKVSRVIRQNKLERYDEMQRAALNVAATGKKG